MLARAPQRTIINFHGIGEPARALEPGEAPFWLGAQQFGQVLDQIAAHPDRARFAITFDDSNISDLAIAVPELAKRGMTACFFVLTGRMGSPGSLDRSHIREMAAAGMGIGSHGIDHRDLSRLGGRDLRAELAASRAVLEDVVQAKVETFSIPFGRYNAGVLAAIRRAGYGAAYTSDGGAARDSDFLRPRRSLRCDIDDTELGAVLSGQLSAAKRLRRLIGMSLKRLA